MLQKFFRKYGNALVFAYLIPAAFFLAWIETEFNAPFDMAFRYLTLPVLVLVYLIVFFCMKSWVEENSTLMVVTWPALVSLFLVLFSSPYLSFANTVFGDQTTIQVEGVITDLRRYDDSFVIEMINASDLDTLRLYVSRAEFNKLQIGDAYLREMQEGGLGFVYKKRW